MDEMMTKIKIDNYRNNNNNKAYFLKASYILFLVSITNFNSILFNTITIYSALLIKTADYIFLI